VSRGLVALLALTCGAAVANIYWAQPLLDDIGRSLGVATGTAAAVVVAAQVGYALGLGFVVPLGDLVRRRRLVVGMLAAAAVACMASAAAPSLAVLAAVTVGLGVASAVVQVLVPLASDLAADHERGRVVGLVVSGLLIGILSARTVAGLVAAAFGWRAVFVLAAALMLALTAALARGLPAPEPKTRGAYPALLRSVPTLVREERVLRLRMAYGAVGMLSFTLLWTGLTLVLSADPFDYGEATIGLFGLAGLAGALAAQGAGRLADRGRGRAGTGFFWSIALVGWGLAALLDTGIAFLVAGLVVFDAGLQGQHVLNQSAIYALRPEARSRLNTAYMVSVFIAAALGSALASIAFGLGGWGLVCALGAACPLVALTLWARDGLAHREHR